MYMMKLRDNIIRQLYTKNDHNNIEIEMCQSLHLMKSFFDNYFSMSSKIMSHCKQQTLSGSTNYSNCSK